MNLRASDSFDITWDDPADAALTWAFDQVHAPRPLPPLSMHLFASFYRGVLGAPVAVANGYGFFHNLTVPPPPEEVMRRGVVDVWENDYLPRIREHCQTVRDADYGGLTAVELVEHLSRLVDETTETLRLTLVVVFAFMGPTLELVQFSEEEMGPDGPVLAGTALQGLENKSATAGVGLSELAEEAAKHTAVAAALRAGDYDGIASVTGGAEFLAHFQSYLDEYGWRLESWSLSHEPTWAENPRVPLGLIGRYLQDPALTPGAAVSRSREQRLAAIAAMESRVAPESRERLTALLAATQSHVAISESRALWQLITLGVFRVPAHALGARLVSAGVLDDPNDVFYLELNELREAAKDRPEGWRAIVASRKADIQRWEKLEPPPFLGQPPDMASLPPEMLPVFRHFFGLGVVPSGEPTLIRGNPASAGIARGTARVVHTLAEAERLQAGDVLVCPTTAPPWTPLFAIASAVVTDSGGVLSHSAICAREYAIPCVVGTMTGTRTIKDGATVTVDGGAVTVTVEV